MGTDCRIWMPPDARLDDVANVIGILVGCKPEWNDSEKELYLRVPGVTVKGNEYPGLATCSNIDIESESLLNLCDYKRLHVMWHWEPGEFCLGYHLLMPRSTALWLAIGNALINFFGGAIDYNDCDSVEIDNMVYCQYKNNPTDGKAWDDHQHRMFNIRPLDKSDILKWKQHAAYK